MAVVFALQKLSGGAVFASRDASGTTNYDLTASALLGSTPVLGTPVLSAAAISGIWAEIGVYSTVWSDL